MKLKLIPVLLFSCISYLPGHSQVLMSILFGDKLNSEKLSFGLHMDYSWNTLSETSPKKALTSFNLGLFFTYHANEQWHINLEMLPKYRRGAKGLQPYDLGNDSLNYQFSSGSVERQINYLSLPVSVQYQTPIGIYAELGPQVSFRLKTYDFFHATNDGDKLQLQRDIRDNIQRWDIGWLAGIGYRLGKDQKISLGLRYNGGFTDVVKNETGTQHHEQWGIYTNFPIGGKKGKTDTEEKK